MGEVTVGVLLVPGVVVVAGVCVVAWRLACAVAARARPARVERAAAALADLAAKTPAGGLVRLVGPGQPWPSDVDGLILGGCWASRATDVGLRRCSTQPTNVAGLCADHATTLQQVRHEHAVHDRGGRP
ncbi:MAG TPA: hypothetical protein VGA69_04075 [Nitriliruptorales bacterium]